MENSYFLKRATVKGFIVDSNTDDPTGIQCPRTQCNETVVYNGNYFCSCGWALADGTYNKGQQDYVDQLIAGLKEFRSKSNANI